jgi:ligand-binding sensor domain-containing protein
MPTFLHVLVSILILVSPNAYSQVKPVPSKAVSVDVLGIQVSPIYGTSIATSDGLSYKSATGNYKILRPSTKQWYVSGTAFDEQGLLWVATGDGVYQLNGSGSNITSVLPNVAASSITVDSANVVWAGSVGQGVAKISDGKTYWYTTSDGLPSNQILTLMNAADDKQVWAGTMEGLAVLKGSTWKTVNSLKGHVVFSTAEYGGKVFAGTDDGIYFGKDVNANWKKAPGSQGKVVTAVHAGYGDLMFGTKDGTILVYRQDKLSSAPRVLTSKELGLSGDPITSIATQSDNNLLVGSFGGGLKTISSASWKSMTSTSSSLPVNRKNLKP